MSLLALGLNHDTAPVEFRERVAFTPEQLPAALSGLADVAGVREAAILSTCNRTEIYCSLAGGDAQAVLGWLGDWHLVEPESMRHHIYLFPGPQAVRHLLRVAAGLDSMVLGEPQILGQLKDAYHQAVASGTLRATLDRLFQHSFAVAKQIRTDTQIGSSPVSVAFAAVSLARQIFEDMSEQTALLIGAGETVELAARHLKQQGIGRIIVANRTLERAHELASRFGGLAITLDELTEHLVEADIVLASTASSEPLLRLKAVKAVLKRRRHRPVFMVDIAVPRDIEASVGELEDVYLYTVDDLRGIIEDNVRSRRAAADQAEEIIDAQVDQFMAWLRSLDAVEAIRELRELGQNICGEAQERACRQLASGAAPERVMEELARRITNKLLHGPTIELRKAAEEGRAERIALLKAMYAKPNGKSR